MLRHAGSAGILLLVQCLGGLAHPANGAAPQDPAGSTDAKLRSCAALGQRGPGLEQLAKACEYAVALPRTLPDLVCRVTVERQLDARRRPDIITAELTVEKMRSHYAAVIVNGKLPTREEKSDDELFAEQAISTGEFALLFNVFDSASHTAFAAPADAVVDHRRLQRYDFTVQRENNLGWTWYFLGNPVNPGYHGSIFIDGKTGEVVRLVLEVTGSEVGPRTPIAEATTTVDYGDVVIGEAGRQHVPLHSENVSCFRGSMGCIRAKVSFSHFHKFGAETRIVP